MSRNSSCDSIELEMATRNGENDSPGMMNGHMDGEVYSDDDHDQVPCLEIDEQPQARGFRFRYECEGPSHGGLQGEKSERYRKTFPSIRIRHYSGPAKVVVTLVTDEAVPKAHAHKLVGRDCQNGICVKEVKTGNMPITFPNLCVQHITRRKAAEVLQERICETMVLDRKVQQGDLNAEISLTRDEMAEAKNTAEKQAKDMQLNVVRLCFQAYLRSESGSFLQLLPSVISTPIYDSKSPGANALKICRMDKYGGCCTGNEEVFLLCEKVQKDDISVRFVEQNEAGHIVWEDYGQFGPYDVHRQFAIVFKTPRYYNTNIEKPVNVLIMLQRKTDQEVSDPKSFTYYPQSNDIENLNRKRRKVIPQYLRGNYHDMDRKDGSSFGSGGGGGDGTESNGNQNGDSGRQLPVFQELKHSPIEMSSQSQRVAMAKAVRRDIAPIPRPIQPYGRQAMSMGVTPQLGREPSLQELSPPFPMNDSTQYRSGPTHYREMPSPYPKNQGSPSGDYPMGSPSAPQPLYNTSHSPVTVKSDPSPIQQDGMVGNQGFMDRPSINPSTTSNPMGFSSMPVTTLGTQLPQDGLMMDGYHQTSLEGIDDITPTLNVAQMSGNNTFVPASSAVAPHSVPTYASTAQTVGYDVSMQAVPVAGQFGNTARHELLNQSQSSGFDMESNLQLQPDQLDQLIGIINQNNLLQVEEIPYSAPTLTLTSRSCSGGMYQRPVDVGYDMVDGFDVPDAQLAEKFSGASAAILDDAKAVPSVDEKRETKSLESPVEASTATQQTVTVRETKDVGIQVDTTNTERRDTQDDFMRTVLKTSQALQVYAASGDIRCLLMVQRYLMAVQDQNGDLPLHTSLINMNYEVFQNILDVMCTLPDAKQRVNAYNHDQQTPLHLAVLTNQPLAVDLLIRAGADSSRQDRNGNTPAHLAILYGHNDCLSFLVKYARRGVNKKTAPFPELNIKNFDGFSPAHLAAQTENLAAVKLLVKAQANVNLPDGKSGRSPLHHAVEADELSIAAFLILQAGAQVNVKRFDGNTPLHIACGRSNVGMVALLMAGGADPNTENDDIEDLSSDDEDQDEVMTSHDEVDGSEQEVPSVSSSATSSPGKREEEEEEEGENKRYFNPRSNRGLIPADFVNDNEKILKILRGEPYTSIMEVERQSREKPEEEFTSMMSSLRLVSTKVESGLGSMTVSDLDKIDYPTRVGLSKLLDRPQPGSDWLALAERLGLRKEVQDQVEGHSPTRLLLTYYEGCGGTVMHLTQALMDIRREDAINLLNNAQYMNPSRNSEKGCSDPAFDSGLSDLVNQKPMTA